MDFRINATMLFKSNLYVYFSNGIRYVFDVNKLEIPNIVAAKPDDNSDGMFVIDKDGKEIEIDMETIRYLGDPEYAAQIDASIEANRMTPEEFDKKAAQLPKIYFPEEDLF